MPERNDLDFEFDDEETEYDLDDEDAEGDDDEYEDGDDEYDEFEDYDEYEDDEGSQGGNWKKTALFAIIGLMVAGAGAYYFMSDGKLPFLAQKEPVPGASPFANPGGFGKVAKAPEAEAEPPAAIPPVPVDESPQAEEPLPLDTEAPQPVVNVPAEPVATPKPAAKATPKPAPKAAKPPAPKPTAKPAATKQAKAKAVAPRRYAVQVGSFADPTNAQNLLAALKAKGYSEAYLDGNGTITGAYAVRSTVVDSSAKANELRDQFAAAGHPGSVVKVGNNQYAIQLGIYTSRSSADNLAAELNAQGMFVSVASGASKRIGATRVRVGNLDSLSAANQLASKLRSEGIPAIPVRR